MKRLFMLGIDGLPPATFRRFLGEGIMPNAERLLAAGALFDVVPTLPALTSPGWLTIGTGARPESLGVANVLQPVPGKAPDVIANGFDRSLNRAEFLWESMAAQGHPAVVVKYPGSWPPRESSVVQVDGAGGYGDITCHFEAVSSAAYVTDAVPSEPTTDGCCAVPTGYGDHWRIDAGPAGYLHTQVRDPVGWTGVPADFSPSFEAVLPVESAGQRRRLILHALAGTRAGEPCLIVAESKDLSDQRGRCAELGVGQWSDWINGTGDRGAFAFRLKVLILEPAAGRLHIYRSEGHLSSGFTRPPELADALVDKLGPVCEWTGTFDVMNGLIDLDTQLEVYDEHTAWLEGAVRQLALNPWQGFFMHWHVLEYAHHIGGASLDEVHPLHHVDKEKFVSFLRGTYRLLDRLIGTAMACADQPTDAFALTSDHGHDLVHTLFYINDFLREHGWLPANRHDDDLRIDWARTAAYGIFPGLIVLNRSSRWEHGTVADEHAEELLAEISSALRTLIDPRTGRGIVTAVIGPAEMAAWGHSGPEAPDLFLTMDRGYEPATRLRADSDSVFAITEPGKRLTSGHGSFHPTSPSARTLAILRDRSIAAGSVARHPIDIVDLAPTFAQLLEVPPPAQADGRPLDFASLGVAAQAGDVR
ncbi:MAG: alkaline phosphatase family protein [Jatrophihabitans sp.]